MSEIPQYISKSKKTKNLQQLINEALYILDNLGVPLEGITLRRRERIGMAFLAVANIKQSGDWKNINDSHALRTRDIIRYWNNHFDENISDSSYDDIRRKDLKLTVLAKIINSSSANPNAARNDGTRSYALNSEYIGLIKKFGDLNWEEDVEKFLSNRETLEQQLSERRDINLIPITLASGQSFEFSLGEHNELQKAIIEEFLPRYGYGSELLYVGDSSNKLLYLKSERLKNLNFFELSHGELPDIIAYSQQRNWLYLIEAVHSSGAITPIRLLELKRLTENCVAEMIFVTAFLNRKTFRKFAPDIAWETEVWISQAPEHIIHFDGEKFLGPYSPKDSI
jgi:type II restriction enzyme